MMRGHRVASCYWPASALFLWPAAVFAAAPVAVDQSTNDVAPEKSKASDVTADRTSAENQLDGPSRRLPTVLELGADVGFLSRSFDYHQDVNDNLRDHDVSLAPVVGARARWYPGAHFTSGSAANLGIIAEYERSVFASSNAESGEDFDTVMQQYAVGARWRFPFEQHEVGASFVYGRHIFTIDAGREPDAVAANGLEVVRDYVPDVDYAYVRPGLDARVAFGRVHAGLGIGYRAIQDIGEAHGDEWFPQATAHALDGWLMVGFEVMPNLIVSGGADFSRYALDMNSTVQDLTLPRDVAGGAIDQSITARVRIEWRLPAAESTGAAVSNTPRDSQAN
jgi:hypothetical protein